MPKREEIQQSSAIDNGKQRDCVWPMKKVLFFALLAGALAHAQETPPTADSILQEMERTYAALRSYSDTTTVDFRNPDGSAGTHVDFKIWFARPKFVRLDATSHKTPDAPAYREVIWCDGGAVRVWSSETPVETRSSVQLVGSKMFGTYAYHIPTLLDASYGGAQRLHLLESPTLLHDERVDEVDCHHVHGNWSGDPYDVWIGKDDHLVRKIVANYQGYIMEEVHRNIVTDHPMDTSVFRFAPEEEGGMKKATPPPRLPGEHRRP